MHYASFTSLQHRDWIQQCMTLQRRRFSLTLLTQNVCSTALGMGLQVTEHNAALEDVSEWAQLRVSNPTRELCITTTLVQSIAERGLVSLCEKIKTGAVCVLILAPASAPHTALCNVEDRFSVNGGLMEGDRSSGRGTMPEPTAY